MASISRSRRVPEPRSGGKIVRVRRTASAKTPYDRPRPSNPDSRSPNWLSRFVFSPTRLVAAGAGKVISSVFQLDSSQTTSSSSTSISSSYSGSDSSAEEEIGTFDDENDIPIQGDDVLKKSGALEVSNSSGTDLHRLVGNSKNKHVIEQLLMQETFSREECDRLIKIIRSRVVASPTNEDERDKRPSEMPNRTLDIDTTDLCNTAVMEARKWLKEKKSGLDSTSDLGYGSHSLNLVTLPQALEHEGSPVDVAKLYMHSRPPWASPSLDHVKPPTPIRTHPFKEETPYPVSGNPTPSSKLKRDSPFTGSWSIQDELRRVRSRATEQMLRTLPSSKIDWSAIAVDCKSNDNSSAIEDIGPSLGENVHNCTNPIDASSNLARELSTQASPDFERKQDGFQPEAMLCDQANINSEQNQVIEATQQTEGFQDDCREITILGQKVRSSDDARAVAHSDGDLGKATGIDGTNGANHLLNCLTVEETIEDLDSRLLDVNHLPFKEKDGAEDALANGHPSSGSSFYAGQVIEQNTKTLHNEHNTVGSGQEMIAKGVIGQGNRELLSGTSVEVPDVNLNNAVAITEDDGVATGSQNSSSVQYEVQQDPSQPGLEPDMATATSTIAGKQKAKRITRYNRRGKARGVK